MIYLISNCTSAKKIKSSSELMLKNYNNDLEETIKEWKLNLKKFDGQRTIAKKLYKGPTWKATLDTEEIFLKKFESKLLISSAGYGIIDSEREIGSYDSTFSKGNENSVYRFKQENSTKKWWNKINEYDVNNFTDNDIVFVFVSYEYLVAMENYLLEISERVNKKLFLIVSSSVVIPEKLKKFVLHFDSRFNSFEKGTFISLTQRCMRWLSGEIVNKNLEFEHSLIQSHIRNFLEKYKKYENHKGKTLSDNELLLKIKEQIEVEKIKSATQGLKNLRKNGLACEQKRYSRLFREIKIGSKS